MNNTRLLVLVTIVMCAFAANSVLNRIGVAIYGMDPFSFAAVRTCSGVIMLWLLLGIRKKPSPTILSAKRFAGATALALYMLSFSWAYITLDAGLGALILFGVLQIVIFAWAVCEGRDIPFARWCGACIALAGLCFLLWPSENANIPITGVTAMAIAGISWAAYTLLGRSEADPLGATASNFLLCLPIVVLVMLCNGMGAMPAQGMITAIVAGAVTSGLGYALWYHTLLSLPTTLAGIAQLSVPVIAIVAGSILLSEPFTLRLIISGVIVLGGIAISLHAKS